MNSTLGKILCLLLLSLVTTKLCAAPSLSGGPTLAVTNLYNASGSSESFNGSYDSSPDGQGLWYEEGGWYVKPKPDGSGWQAGLISPADYLGNTEYYGTNAIMLSWTPTGGWIIDQGPPGLFLLKDTYDSDGNFTGKVPITSDAQFVIKDGESILFDSSSFVEGVTNSEGEASWDALLSSYFSSRPGLVNPFSPNNNSQLQEQAQSVTKKLSFENGEWRPQN